MCNQAIGESREVSIWAWASGELLFAHDCCLAAIDKVDPALAVVERGGHGIQFRDKARVFLVRTYKKNQQACSPSCPSTPGR